jgi:purine-nucleoside phosphorylase
MQGRFHHYEGYSMQTIAYPIKVLKLLGVKYLILTNAAGCLNEKWQPGDLMVISDHIKLQAESPLTGQQQDGLLGPRFFDMSNAYDAELRKYAREIASRQHIAIKEGVYQYFTGPNFETPAEIRAARLLGADAVGMSTVPEAITAAYLGLRTLGLSCLTNMGAGMTKKAIDGNDVLETSMKVKDTFTAYMKQLVTEWPR